VKVLHVETGRHLYGGPQQVIYLAQGLVERGHDCTLVCPPGSGIDAAARMAGLAVRNLFCAGDLDLPFAYRLTQYLKDARPDIVHCHSRRGADVLGGLAASFADVPAVVSRRVDNTEVSMLAALRYRPFRKIVAISAAVARALRAQGVEADRIEIIRSAVDTPVLGPPPDCARLRSEFGIPGTAIVLAAAGQLIARKGHRFLLEAASALAASHPDLRLLIFGDGPLDAELRAQATALGLDEVVSFPGFRDDLDAFMGCFDIFVHPALAEGLGVVTLKAAAAGVPVVAFDAGGLGEAVVDGETGLLVEAGNAGALRDALETLLADRGLASRLGAAGRERMQTEFTIATMVDKHVRLYESVIDG
jgi:glycosyltransferase involved in cell wall biosynthesis